VAKLHFGEWPVGTRAIVRLGGWMRMVTKGYRKGVYERVTKGIRGGTGGLWLVIQMRYGAA
ncbi:MAG: hypothetical protein WBQ81_14415, partial [Candidatus Sulfotelmatobacter sp.]